MKRLWHGEEVVAGGCISVMVSMAEAAETQRQQPCRQGGDGLAVLQLESKVDSSRRRVERCESTRVGGWRRVEPESND